MRQIHYLLLTTYLLFLVHPVLAQPALDAPDIYTEEDSFNFGLIEEGEKPDHKFIVGNRGNKDLAIERVRTTCGCTSAILGSKTVAPGQTTEVKLTYDSKGRPGKFNRQAYIHSNDPDEPAKKITISGDVVKRTPEPAKISLEGSLDIGVIEAGNPNRTELKITNAGGQDLIILEIEEGRHTTTDTEDSPPTIAPGSSYNLKLSISSPKKGVLSDTIVIISNAGRKEVAISGYLLEGSRGIYPWCLSDLSSHRPWLPQIPDRSAGNRKNRPICLSLDRWPGLCLWGSQSLQLLSGKEGKGQRDEAPASKLLKKEDHGHH